MGHCLQHQKTQKSMINQLKDLVFSLLNRQTINLVSDESLKDQVIIVSGASKGIGKDVAKVLYEQGANLALFSRNLEELKKVFADFDNNKIMLLKADVSSYKDIVNVVDKTIKKFGKIDVLINNAGLFKGDYLENISEENWDKLISINIKGVFSMTKAVIPLMKNQRSGLIINIGSRISHNTNIQAKKVLYATTKFAVEGFSRALNNELKPWGIKVTCLMPGTVNTFRSLQPQKYLSPYTIGQIISSIIKLEDVDFESIVLKSKYEL